MSDDLTFDGTAESIPPELRDRLDRQDPETLRAVLAYVRDSLDAELPLANNRAELDAENVADPEELTRRADEFVDEHLDAGRPVRVQKWMRNCVDGCSSCPHGPYLVGVWVEDGRKHWKWLGSVAE